jgi:hypothetical protein
VDEMLLMMLIKRYNMQFGMTFSSDAVATEEGQTKVAKLMQEALAGKRGPVSDDDIKNCCLE